MGATELTRKGAIVGEALERWAAGVEEEEGRLGRFRRILSEMQDRLAAAVWYKCRSR